MPEAVNTSALGTDTGFEAQDSRESMIKVENVSMVFNMASEQLNSLKEYAIKLARRQLFFTGFKALDNVSFEVKRGDVFGIIGTNGSGKSTMLKIIAGVLEPSEGSCVINGSIAPLIELGAGFDLELTARENIFLNGALLGYSKSFITENFADIVAFAEIEQFLDMPMKNFSSGMVARVAFAIATVIVPEILIVDEVLSVGDFMFQRKCENRISELIETYGVTVLIVSHTIEQIERLCNKVIWIEKGHTRMIGDPADICQTYRVLGGRIGSAESEARVFKAINVLSALHDDQYTMIAGEDYYDTAAKTTSIVWGNMNTNAAVVACGGTHINTILANGLAGAYNIPVLQTRTNRIPDSVVELLEEYRPTKIFFIDWESNAQSALKHLRQLEWIPDIIDFSFNGSIFELSKAIFSFGQEQGIWGSTAVVVDFSDNSESLAAAPYAFTHRCPVFSASISAPLNSNELVALLSMAEIKEVLIFGKTIKEEIDTQCKQAGIKTRRFSSESIYESCINICDWLFTTSDTTKKELCVASLTMSQWPDILACGTYCGVQESALLLVDSADLDSVAASFDFITDRKDVISHLTFFGGDSNLNELDRELLSRELL